MPPDFISLEEYLRIRGRTRSSAGPAPQVALVQDAAPPVCEEVGSAGAIPRDDGEAEGDVDSDVAASARHVGAELALLKLAAHETFGRAIARLLDGLAREVLARELATADVDLVALCEQALHAFASEEPLAFVVAPVEVERIGGLGLPVRVDGALRGGDLVVEVRDGAIDARLAVRLRGAVDEAMS